MSWTHARRTGSWFAGKRLLEGNDYGRIMDIVMGIVGATVGGILLQVASLDGSSRAVSTTVVAMIGAMLLTLAARRVQERKLYQSGNSGSRASAGLSHARKK
ncbi:MAG: GlsB/YeaQ/YmgE family stress response membrane protein [Candidatus Acidiferrum sp.]